MNKVCPLQERFPHILVLADKTTNLLIEKYLASEAYYIQYATTRQAALVHIQQHTPSLLLCDSKLFYEDECKAHQEIFGSREYNIPTIFLVAGTLINELTDGSVARRIDYLNKPFTKYELCTRIRNQMVLLSAKNRLIRLRAFTNQIACTNDIDSLMYRAFEFLQEEIIITDVTLFRGDDICYTSSGNKNAIREAFDVVKYTTHADICHTQCQGEYHYLLFRLSGAKAWTFVVRIQSASFTDFEKEYIYNLIHQIHVVKDTLQQIFCDPGTITNLYNIVSRIDQVLFIKSAKQYVEIYVKKQRPELLTIPLKTVCLYMKEHLLKVHRSYLINPKEILRVNKKKHGRYEIIMKDYVIPIGEVYLPIFRDKYAHLFYGSSAN
jgi:CheY-like chemotaxis protein